MSARLSRASLVVLLVLAALLPGALAGAKPLDFPIAGQLAPAPDGPDSTVYPGGVVQSKRGDCTFNFLFTDDEGRRYMGTAGHCIIGEGQQRSWARGKGPVAKDAVGNKVGKFVFAVFQDPKDFALIKLQKDVAADPQMCAFGGPTGINDDRTASPVILQFCGRGLLVGDVTPARTGVATSMADPDHVFMDTVAVPGDSGSGVTSRDGRAVGVLVTVGLHLGGIGTDGLDAGLVGVTRLRPQLDRAEDVLGVDFKLVRAPLL